MTTEATVDCFLVALAGLFFELQGHICCILNPHPQSHMIRGVVARIVAAELPTVGAASSLVSESSESSKIWSKSPVIGGVAGE